jgi:hypothetical protein
LAAAAVWSRRSKLFARIADQRSSTAIGIAMKCIDKFVRQQFVATLVVVIVSAQTGQLPCEANDRSKSRSTVGPIADVVPATIPADPTDGQLSAAPVFANALVPMHTHAMAGENKDLGAAIREFSKRQRGDVKPFEDFLRAFPQSRWAASVKLNIGEKKFDDGYFSEAIEL